MELLRQFALIAGISCLGEGLRMLIPLPVPASVYGLVLMLAGLLTGVIRIERVHHGALFLIEIMPLMFIPAAVGLPNAWNDLAPVWLHYPDNNGDRDGRIRPDDPGDDPLGGKEKTP